MKVAIITSDFYIGGGQRVVCELAKHMDKQAADIKIFCVGRRIDTKMACEAEEKADVVYFDALGKNKIKNFVKVFSALLKYRPDIINAHLIGQLYAVPFGAIFRTPTIITVHSKPQKAFYERLLFLVRWGLKHASFSLVAVSEENLKLVKEYFQCSTTG